VVARKAGARLHGLREFLTGAVADRGLLWPDSDDEFSSDTLAVDLDGAKLLFVATRSHSTSREERRSTLSASVGWTFDPELDLETIEREYVGVLRDLVLFATRRRSFTTSLDLTIGDSRMATVKVVRQAALQDRDEREIYALALNLVDHDDPAALVARWYALRGRIGPVWDIFFSALDRPESLLEDRLLGLLAFAEGYHRALLDERPLTRKQQKSAEKAIKGAIDDPEVRAVYRRALSHANSQTQRDRLEVLTRRALEVVSDWWYVDTDVFLDRLIHTRNWLIHWGKRSTGVVNDSAGMVELVRGLIVVLYANLLRDLGLSVEEAGKVIGSGWRLEGMPDDVFEEGSEGD